LMRRSRCRRRRRGGLGLVGRLLVDGEMFLRYRIGLHYLEAQYKTKCSSHVSEV
jgi:hypothetical protein